ncbi:MAG TPA: tetratricopeptide repeat protein [Spirochaetia bacterium]|nr:tetratricopeptide repeat protein [Spirochaetaceae bacterium]HPE87886.1 tetratricopeptide repeat protein [Spirochaetales bacterium]HRW23299.1 tetratricopeptide repeat protein [Spirochaetia bacterium]
MSSKEIGATSATQAAPKDEVKFAERLGDFIRANRVALVVVGSLMLAAVIGLGVYSVVSSDRLQKSTVALEALEAGFADWNALEGEARTAKGGELVAEADAVAAKYGKLYAAGRASMIKAELLFAMSDLPGSEKAYLAAAASNPGSHLAPVALANAASVAEDRGDNEAALSYLARVEAEYPSAPGIGRVTLSIGRIYENTKRYGEAMEAYTRLIATGAESDWTKIAHARIILLKSQGLAD